MQREPSSQLVSPHYIHQGHLPWPQQGPTLLWGTARRSVRQAKVNVLFHFLNRCHSKRKFRPFEPFWDLSPVCLYLKLQKCLKFSQFQGDMMRLQLLALRLQLLALRSLEERQCSSAKYYRFPVVSNTLKYVIFSMWLAEEGSVKSWTSIKSDWKLAAGNILLDYLFHFPYPNSPGGTVTMTITRKTPADGRLVQSICLALPMKTSCSLFPHFWRADSWCKQDALSGKGPHALLQLFH